VQSRLPHAHETLVLGRHHRQRFFEIAQVRIELGESLVILSPQCPGQKTAQPRGALAERLGGLAGISFER
jgi:hypothetical protein